MNIEELYKQFVVVALGPERFKYQGGYGLCYGFEVFVGKTDIAYAYCQARIQAHFGENCPWKHKWKDDHESRRQYLLEECKRLNIPVPGVDKVLKVCDNTTSNGEKKMTNNKTTRYAVISRNTGKVLKNAPTREVAREWKRNSGKNGLGILDRNSGVIIS